MPNKGNRYIVFYYFYNNNIYNLGSIYFYAKYNNFGIKLENP